MCGLTVHDLIKQVEDEIDIEFIVSTAEIHKRLQVNSFEGEKKILSSMG